MKTSRVAVLKQLMAASFCSFGVLVAGTIIGWPTPTIVKIKETGVPMNLTNGEIGLMVSILYAGNIVSPIPAGYVMDLVGRKTTLLIISVFPLSGWIIVYFATHAYELYIARCLFGLWNGSLATIVPLYIAEIAEAKIRGVLSSMLQLSFNVGILFSFAVGPHVNYYTFSFILGFLPVSFVLFFGFMPESPYWLLIKQKRENAVKSLIWLRAAKYEMIESELEYMERSISEEMDRKNAFKKLFSGRSYKQALITVLFIAFCQRMSGIVVVMAFASTSLPSDGIGLLSNSQSVIVLGTIWTAAVLLASIFIDHMGRRPLLMISSFGCGLVMFVTGLHYFLIELTSVDMSDTGYVIFVCFLVFGFSFYCGLGPVAATLHGEMFPSNVKAVASALVVITLSITSYISIIIYHPIGNSVGFYLVYWIFCLFCFAVSLFVAFYVIETKGKTLHEIQVELDDKRRRITLFRSHVQN